MSIRRLIVNADDFGQSAGINRGVLMAHDQGVVTSTSAMVRWPGAVEAAREATQRPQLSVGLHVDLGEWRLADGEWVAVYEVTRISDARAVEEAVEEQLRMFRDLFGRDPTHLDSHQHVHRRQPVRDVLTRLASELQIPLRHFAPQVRYCGDFYGQDEHGRTLDHLLAAENFSAILESTEPGITELACHPAAAVDLPTMYGEERLKELSTLCDRRVCDTIESLKIKLCSFQDVTSKSS